MGKKKKKLCVPFPAPPCASECRNCLKLVLHRSNADDLTRRDNRSRTREVGGDGSPHRRIESDSVPWHAWVPDGDHARGFRPYRSALSLRSAAFQPTTAGRVQQNQEVQRSLTTPPAAVRRQPLLLVAIGDALILDRLPDGAVKRRARRRCRSRPLWT